MPKWTKRTQDTRNDGRPARIAALYLLTKRGELPDIPKTQIAERLSVSRWTLDRDLSSVAEMDNQVAEMMKLIASE